jgi:hypothetical protein
MEIRVLGWEAYANLPSFTSSRWVLRVRDFTRSSISGKVLKMCWNSGMVRS